MFYIAFVITTFGKAFCDIVIDCFPSSNITSLNIKTSFICVFLTSAVTQAEVLFWVGSYKIGLTKMNISLKICIPEKWVLPCNIYDTL